MSDCVEGPVQQPKSKVGRFQPYGDHPHRWRATCQTVLKKSFEFVGRRILYPFIYCYLGVEATLQQVLQRPNIDK